MATVTWLDVDGNINNTANYSSGAKPSNGDTFNVPSGNKTVTTNPTGLGAINLADALIGVNFTGQWGSVSAPITFGTCTGRLRVNAPRAGLIAVTPVAWPTVEIADCGEGPSYLYIGGGTITDLVVLGGGRIVVGASATVTTIHVVGGSGTRPSPTVDIEAGATVTTLIATAGVVNNYAAITNIKYSGSARVYNLGDASIGTTTVEGYGSQARMQVDAQGTHASVKTYAGAVFDASRDMRTKTVTASIANSGSQIILGSHVSISTAIARGGRILGVAPTTIEGTPDTLGTVG